VFCSFYLGNFRDNHKFINNLTYSKENSKVAIEEYRKIRINFLSCIKRLLINPMLKITIHLFTVSHNINGTVKPLFKILFDTDKVEQVRIFKLNYHVDVTLVLK